MFVVRPSLNSKEIERRLDDYNMFKYYCTNFKKVGVKFRAEFTTDRHPSACITSYKGKLWYKDFGDPRQDKAYNIYAFVMRKYNITFVETLNKINQDFNLNLGSSTGKVATIKYNNSSIIKYPDKNDNLSVIRVKKTKLLPKHIHFYSKYGIKERDVPNLLKKFGVFPITHYWLQNTSRINNKMFVINGIGFDYDYYWYKNVYLRKIYLPRKTGSLFFTNCNTLITQGYKQLPKTGKLVFVTSSLKDAMILSYFGYPAVAPSNENVFIQEHIFEELKLRFKNVIIFYDNDYTKRENWGKLFAKKHSEKYNVPYIFLPDNTAKDPSDFSRKYGGRELKYIIDEKIKNQKCY